VDRQESQDKTVFSKVRNPSLNSEKGVVKYGPDGCYSRNYGKVKMIFV
jgi:hypothetical protein